MADRYLIETSAVDGYLMEDGLGVLILEQQAGADAPAPTHTVHHLGPMELYPGRGGLRY